MRQFLILALMLSAAVTVSGQKYDTIQVGLSTTVNLIFESSIVKKHLGSGTYVENNEETQDVLIEHNLERMTLTARIEKFEPTNLFVETEGGFYNFILVYNEWPRQQLQAVNIEQATIVKKVKADPKKEAAKIEASQNQKQRDTLAVLAQKAFEKGHLKNPDIGEIDQKMTFYLDGIYVDGNYLLFRVAMKNEGNVQYDLGFEGFFIKEDESRSTKRDSKAAPLPLQAIYTLNEDVKIIDRRKEVIKVYVFNKFTVEKGKHFSIEIWEAEKKGQRKVELEVPDKEILNAKVL